MLEREAEEAKAQAKYEEEEAKWEKRRDESRAILAKTMQAELDAETSKLLTENGIIFTLFPTSLECSLFFGLRY